MKNSYLMSGILLIAMLTSCESSKIKKESTGMATLFFLYLKNGDEGKLVDIYQGFSKFSTYFKSDSSSIINTTYKDGIATVTVKNRFTNGYGKTTERDIKLFFKRDSTEKIVLFDSKGLTDFSEKNDYKFGMKTGCITKTDTSDQQILTCLKKSSKVMMGKAVDVYIELEKDIVVASWNWETLYSGSASGKGIVVNNSQYNIPSLKYVVTFLSSSGTPITTDKGVVTYDVLHAGGSTSFSFYSDYVGGATRAQIKLEFDEEMIFSYLAAKDWTGKECDEYFRDHPEEISSAH